MKEILRKHDLELVETIYESEATGRGLYKVRHRALGLNYALKRLDRTRNEPRTVRQEMVALNRVPFGLVPHCHGEFTHGEALFLLLDWVDGEPLAQHFREPVADRYDLGRRLEVLERAARKVGELHKRRIQHRDLKPENIILSGGKDRVDAVELIDLGLAVQDRNDEEGTVGYRAPEQDLRRDRRLDPGTDIFALGQVGWFLIAGEPQPLAYNSDYSDWRSDDPPLLPSCVPSSVVTPLNQATAFDPGKRFKSTGQFAGALRKARRQVEGGKGR